MRIRRAALIVGLWVWLAGSAQPQEIRPGDAAPAFANHAAEGRPGGLMLAVVVPAFSDAAGCRREAEAYAGAQSELREVSVLGVVALDADAIEQYCGKQPAIPFVTGVSETLPAARTGVLLDGGRVVRRVVSGGTAKEHAERVTRETRLWQGGRSLYESLCERCHGADGEATGYPFIERLGGIGSRHTEEEILRRTESTGVVDLSRLSAEDRAALAVYVSGL